MVWFRTPLKLVKPIEALGVGQNLVEKFDNWNFVYFLLQSQNTLFFLALQTSNCIIFQSVDSKMHGYGV